MNETELLMTLSKIGIANTIRRGNNLMACCPSHPESRPSWGISLDDPHKHGCFACGYRGTLRTLLLDKGWSLSRTNNLLGVLSKKELGISWMEDSEISAEYDEPTEMDKVTLYPFFDKHPYLHSFMLRRRIQKPLRKKLNLLFDQKRGRVVFPWYWNNTLVGATGRTVRKNDPNKIIAYGNFKKGNVFYVPHRQLDPDNPVILVEGEVDAIKVYQAGFFNVAALGQGHFTKAHLRRLENLPVKSLVLFLDNDDHGRALVDDIAQMVILSLACDVYVVSYGKRKGKDPGELSSLAITNMLQGISPYIYWPKF